MAEKGFDIEIPQYCTFVVAEMNRRIKELRVANTGKTEQEILSVLGKFLEEGIEALACGMVTPCDEYWSKVYEYSSGRLQTANERKKRDRERKARAKEGVPDAEPVPMVDDAEGEERNPYGAKKNVMLSDSDVASIRNAYPEATDKDFRIAVDRVSLKWSGKFEKPASWTKSVSGAVEQILIARRDEKYYQQKEGFRKDREERKAEKAKMIEGVRNSLNFEPQEKPTVPDEFEVPF